MADEFDDVEDMLEAPFRKDMGSEVRGSIFAWSASLCFVAVLVPSQVDFLSFHLKAHPCSYNFVLDFFTVDLYESVHI